LDAAFTKAQAVVVLLTPDDVAQMREPFRNTSDPPYEAQMTGQARPNVLFEAGMAMGRNPDRTVIIELGAVRPFSDIAGRHTVKLSNDPEARHELAQRLETAGCAVDLSGRDWHKEGDFNIQSPPPVSPAPVSTRTRRRYGYWVAALFILAAAVAVFWVYRVRVGTHKQSYEFDKDRPAAAFTSNQHIVEPPESYKIHEVLQLPVPDYSKFEILQDRRVIDLRGWKPFEKGAEGRVSPVTWSRRVRLRKVEEVEWMRFVFATDGAGIDAECSSGNDYYLETGVVSATPPQLLLKAFHMVVNVARYKVGEDFEVELMATFWNGTPEKEDWVAYKVYAPVKIISMMLLFPEHKVFQWK
jgi:hypothetical protein